MCQYILYDFSVDPHRRIFISKIILSQIRRGLKKIANFKIILAFVLGFRVNNVVNYRKIKIIIKIKFS